MPMLRPHKTRLLVRGPPLAEPEQAADDGVRPKIFQDLFGPLGQDVAQEGGQEHEAAAEQADVDLEGGPDGDLGDGPGRVLAGAEDGREGEPD